MNQPPAASRPMRRARFGLASAILLGCATVSCLLVGVIGSRYHARWDLTSSRQHTLADRTIGVLREVTEPTTIVVSADLSTIDRESVRRLTDLLDEFSRASPMVRATWIDTSSASAMRDLGALLASLADPVGDQLSAQRVVMEQAATDAETLVVSLRALSDELKALGDAADTDSPGDASPIVRNAREQAGLVRTIASSLEPLGESLRSASANVIAGVSIPAVDSGKSASVDPLDRAARAAGAIAEHAAAVLSQRPTEAVGRAARELSASASRARDLAARAGDAIARLRPSDPLIVARVLEHSSAVLVTGARGTIAVEFGRLFPSGPMRESGRVAGQNTLFAGEQLIATALEGLFGPSAPIIVFVHGQTVTLLDDRGEPTPPAVAAFRTLFERMRMTRATPAEWPVAIRPLRPDLADLDPSGDRPVVWVVLPAPPRTTGDGRQANAAADRAARIRQLAAAVKVLVDGGEHVLSCIEPSDLPSLGEADPVASVFEPFGLRVDSARPLIRTESSPQGPLTWTFQMLSSADRGHPIGRAIDGQRIVLPWATRIEMSERAGVTNQAVLVVRAAPGLWGEAQWMLLRDLVGRGLARPLAPMLLAETPSPDPSRDLVVRDGGEGVVVASASERLRAVGSAGPSGVSPAMPQRLFVVASPEWLSEGYTQASEEVGGRRVLLFPGNLELFDAAVAWLAGRDDRIASGPRGGDVPRIAAIPDGPLRALRIVLFAGLPALVLIAGAILRVWRG